jgi:hypothetical protein
MGDRLQDLRLDLATRSQWNIGYFYAGLVFWIYAAVIGWEFPIPIAKVYWLIGTFFIFPMALLASKLLGADPFCKGNPLGEIVGNTHISVLGMTLPIILICAAQYPDLMILVMAIAYSLDFFLMSWAFGSRLFAIHASVRTVVVSGIWLALPAERAWLVPVAVAIAYGTTALLLPRLRRQWQAAHGASALSQMRSNTSSERP